MCGGGTFGGSDPSAPCSGTLIGPLIVFDIGTIADLTETTPDFALTSFFDVFTEIAVDGGLDGDASLSRSRLNWIRSDTGHSRTDIDAASGLRTGRRAPATQTALMLTSGRRAMASTFSKKGETVRKLTLLFFVTLAAWLVVSQTGIASNHREAPITALDHKADITDLYAFKSYGGSNNGTHVTLILGVDPLLEPGNGPNWFPFDPDILYELKVDNNNDAVEDIVFQFRFRTEQRLPNLFTVYAGVNGGAVAPANSPAPVPQARRSCLPASCPSTPSVLVSARRTS